MGYHEVGHIVIKAYGIRQTKHWFDEIPLKPCQTHCFCRRVALRVKLMRDGGERRSPVAAAGR